VGCPRNETRQSKKSIKTKKKRRTRWTSAIVHKKRGRNQVSIYREKQRQGQRDDGKRHSTNPRRRKHKTAGAGFLWKESQARWGRSPEAMRKRRQRGGVLVSLPQQKSRGKGISPTELAGQENKEQRQVRGGEKGKKKVRQPKDPVRKKKSGDQKKVFDNPATGWGKGGGGRSGPISAPGGGDEKDRKAPRKIKCGFVRGTKKKRVPYHQTPGQKTKCRSGTNYMGRTENHSGSMPARKEKIRNANVPRGGGIGKRTKKKINET